MTHALTFGDQRWSAQDAERAVKERERALVDRGVAAGNIVPFDADSTPDAVWTFHAIVRLGAVAMPRPPNPNRHQQAALEQAEQRPAEPGACLRLLTSGTTGVPRCVDLTRLQLDASAAASAERLAHEQHDQWVCCLPLNHIGGLSILHRSAQAQAGVVLLPKFEPGAVNRALAQGATLVSLVPTMLQRVLDDRYDVPFPAHTRVILLGGAPASVELLDRCRAIHAPVSLTWGMTETASQIATRTPGDLRTDPDCGRPLPGTVVNVEHGRLVVEGVIAPGGRLVTEDRGSLDADGRVIVSGRGSDLIISGGENVDPMRIKQALNDHPAVTDAAVVARTDTEWGQRPVAFVVGTPDGSLNEWLRAELAPHERPAEVHWVEELPRTDLGKLRRSVLVDQADSLHRLGKLSGG